MTKKIFLSLFSVLLLVVGCGARSYDSKPNISPELKVKEEANLSKYSKMIDDFSTTQNPPLDWYLNKSTAQSTIGQNDAAIKTINTALSKYPGEITLLHNLGRIYDGANDCGKAETYYAQIIKSYGIPQYYYDAALCYMHAKDRGNTERNYNEYKKIKPNFSDEEIERFLK